MMSQSTKTAGWIGCTFLIHGTMGWKKPMRQLSPDPNPVGSTAGVQLAGNAGVCCSSLVCQPHFNPTVPFREWEGYGRHEADPFSTILPLFWPPIPLRQFLFQYTQSVFLTNFFWQPSCYYFSLSFHYFFWLFILSCTIYEALCLILLVCVKQMSILPKHGLRHSLYLNDL